MKSLPASFTAKIYKRLLVESHQKPAHCSQKTVHLSLYPSVCLNPIYMLPTLLRSWRLWAAAALEPGYWLVSVVRADFIPGSGCKRNAPTWVRLDQAAHHGTDTRGNLWFSVAQSRSCGHCPARLHEQTPLQRRLADHPAKVHMQGSGQLRKSHCNQEVS